MASCRIRCLNDKCGKIFNSPFQFGDAESFFTSTLIGNKVQCPHCNQMTNCNKENMLFRTDDEGFAGKDT